MAAIRKTVHGTFEVYGYKVINGQKKRFSKSFKTRADARRYLAQTELTIEERSAQIVLSALIDEYIVKVTSKKRSKRTEEARLRRIQRTDLGQLNLSNISRKTIERYIQERLNEQAYHRDNTVAPSTVNRELATLSDVFNFGIENGLTEENPCKGAERPKDPEHRERVATEEDIEKLLLASGWDGVSKPKNLTELSIAAFLFSCRTGMRSGEILKIEKAWIDGNVLHVPAEATKTLSRRDVALSSFALETLSLILALGFEPKIFGPLNDKNRDTLFRKVRDRAGLGPEFDSEGRLIREGLHFHDGRATFATWAASTDPETGAPRLDVLALARQTGHKNLKHLARYYRASAAEIAKRLK